ncbi:TIGR02253 family HAD-type hydrolase [Candidatus Woesearchaeota archaeon]|nr:TIGR02253 family HAD-type hydrolase [Candidatus Woesearchaeota archaeon]
MIKAVIFDLDNTLVDFMRMKKASVSAAVDAMLGAGVRLNKEQATKILYELYDKYGIEYQQIFQKFLQKIHRKIDYKILAAGIVAYRKVQVSFLEPYANAIPTLLKLKQKGYKLAIVSDAPRLRAWLRLVEMRIQDFFDVVVCFDDTNHLKPSRLPFSKAIKALKIKPHECLMVGDWPERDIKGAKALGMTAVFARYGSVKEVKDSGADYEINDISEVVKIADEVNKKCAK